LYNYINNLLSSSYIIFIIVSLLIICISSCVLNDASGRITTNLKEFIRVLDEMAKGNLDVEVIDQDIGSYEMKMVHEGLKNLLITVKFADIAYYAGNLNKALNQYELALKLMISRNNKRGIGVCYNNIANVYKNQKKYDAAIDMYNKAITNINEIIAETKMPIESKDNQIMISHKITRANRLMNLGVVYKDTNDTVQALKLLNSSLVINKECDNAIGMAKVSGNIAQIYIAEKKFVQAEELLLNSYEIIVRKIDMISMQYISMDLGILEYHKKRYDHAINWFNTSIYESKKIDAYVQQTSIKYLKMCYEKTHNDEMVKKLDPMINVAESRDVVFVLDCSGSMAGKPIKDCRKSIQTIITNSLNDCDNIALITFDTKIYEIFPLMEKKANLPYILDTIEKKTSTGSSTAFYDALKQGMEKLHKNTNKSDWLVALTDGMDNASKTSVLSIENIAKKFDGNLVIITVGEIENMATINKICSSAHYGTHIKVDSHNIGVAFNKVSDMIVGQLNVETL
jgi:tetratricopeptide (TPR) repeat protein